MDTKDESPGTLDAAALSRLRAAAMSVFARGPVLAAYAYGSRVRGRPRPESDLDVGYYLRGYRHGQTLSVREELRLASGLSDAFGVEIDLRNLGEGSLELRGRVLEEGVRIYSADEPERVALERYVLSRYHDYKDVFLQMHELRLRSLAERGF
jgi:predicted nucleotidyltransferase